MKRLVLPVAILLAGVLVACDGSSKSSSKHKSSNNSNTGVVTTSSSSSSGKCGTKNTCSSMKSCSEARYFLNACGVSKLDQDGDGTPCESLCK